jgi:methylmalonyl-CoA mutase cobalamin-binding subunit
MDGHSMMRVSGRDAGHGYAAARSVADVVVGEVIPRLLLNRRAPGPERRPTQAHVETLVRLALSRDPVAAGAQVAALREGGVPVDSLLHDLIAPAARRLGDYWSSDAADFVEVALACARLSGIVRSFGGEAMRDAPDAAPRALIATPACERHGLGAMIVAQSFRAAGWRATEAPGATAQELSDSLAAAGCELIGFSASGAPAAEMAIGMIGALRRASRKGRLIVAVGGPGFADPARALAAGADFHALDGRDAVMRAACLLSAGASAENIA